MKFDRLVLDFARCTMSYWSQLHSFIF